MAYGIIHHFPGGTKDNYEASLAAVHPGPGVLPDGQIFHAAGAVPGGWTIVAVHESKESWESFRDNILLPRLQQGSRAGSRRLPKRPRSTSTRSCRSTREEERTCSAATGSPRSSCRPTWSGARSSTRTRSASTLSPETIKNHLLFDCGNGTSLLVYGRGNGNRPTTRRCASGRTDVAADVAALVGRGVEFEEYDMGAFKTVDHVVTTRASAGRRGSRIPTATPSRSSSPSDPSDAGRRCATTQARKPS